MAFLAFQKWSSFISLYGIISGTHTEQAWPVYLFWKSFLLTEHTLAYLAYLKRCTQLALHCAYCLHSSYYRTLRSSARVVEWIGQHTILCNTLDTRTPMHRFGALINNWLSLMRRSIDRSVLLHYDFLPARGLACRFIMASLRCYFTSFSQVKFYSLVF